MVHLFSVVVTYQHVMTYVMVMHMYSGEIEFAHQSIISCLLLFGTGLS